MAYTQTQLLNKLNIWLRDKTDLRWTSEEKTEAIAMAIDDPAFAYVSDDTSLTSSTATQSYALSGISGLENVIDVWINDGVLSRRIDPSQWEQKYGKLIFKSYPPESGTFELTVMKKYTTSDNIPSDMANLLLIISARICYEMLMNKWTSSFLTNDVSMAELQAGLAYWQTRERQERGKMGRNSSRIGYKI